MLDGDSAGRQATERIAEHLAGKRCVRRVIVPTDGQPDQLSEADITALLARDLGPEGESGDFGAGIFNRRNGEFSTGVDTLPIFRPEPFKSTLTICGHWAGKSSET
jgi:hypothetical protein